MRHWCLAVAVVLALCSFALAPEPVGATIGPCNNCPDGGSIISVWDGTTISVSDGTTIDASVLVNDAPFNVTLITYTAHIPVGTKVTGYVFPDSQQTRQTVAFVADQAAGQYQVETSAVDVNTVSVYPELHVKNTGLRLCGEAQATGVTNTVVSTTTSLAAFCGN